MAHKLFEDELDGCAPSDFTKGFHPCLFVGSALYLSVQNWEILIGGVCSEKRILMRILSMSLSVR